MAKKVSTNITLDPDLKKEAIELFSDLGLDLTTAITLFLKQAVIHQRLPFSITRNPSPDTYSRLQKYSELMNKKEDN